MKYWINAITLAALCANMFPAYAVNKCTAADGKVLFQQAACPQSGMTVAEDIKLKEQKRLIKAEQQAVERNLANEANEKNSDASKIRAAKAICNVSIAASPTIGMSEHVATKCTMFGIFNQPTAVNETETKAGITKQFAYKNYSEIRYLYTRAGVVTAIQR